MIACYSKFFSGSWQKGKERLSLKNKFNQMRQKTNIIMTRAIPGKTKHLIKNICFAN